MIHTVAGHVSLFHWCGPYNFVWFSLGPCASADVHSFQVSPSVCKATWCRVPEHSSLGIHGVERTTHLSSVAETLCLRMRRRRFFFFCEPLAIGSCLRSRLFSPPVFVSLLVKAIPRARSYQVVHQLDFCGSIVHPFVQFCDFFLDIWKRAIPIHSSEGKTSPSSLESSFCMWSEALSMLVLFSLMTSTCLDAMRKVVASGTYNFCSMYFVMARCDIFTYASKNCVPFSSPKVVSSSVFHLTPGFHWRAFRRGDVGKDRRV